MRSLRLCLSPPSLPPPLLLSRGGGQGGLARQLLDPAAALPRPTHRNDIIPRGVMSVGAGPDSFSVLFLGTGVSTAIPNLAHVLRAETFGQCQVCADAMRAPHGKNKRNNVSIAIIFSDQKCIVVDVGKTMRDAMVKLFPKHGIDQVHGIFLTHGHADAIMGLDDVRNLQVIEKVLVSSSSASNGPVAGFRVASAAMPIYLTAETKQRVAGAFPYLMEPPLYLDEAAKVMQREVALLDFKVIDATAEVAVHGLQVRTFPVLHGGSYVSLGFSFGAPGEFVYISDVKVIPDETWKYLKALPRIKVLVLDALDHDGIFSHMGLEEALAVCDVLKPERTYLTGIGCDLGLHDDVEKELADRGVRCRLAHDGLLLEGFRA